MKIINFERVEQILDEETCISKILTKLGRHVIDTKDIQLKLELESYPNISVDAVMCILEAELH